MMKPTIALFDADGVVIKPRDKFFTQRLIDDYMVPPEQAEQFVHAVIVPALVDAIDLKQVLPEYIAAWKLPLSVDELLDYWWSGEDTPNDEVLQVVDRLRKHQLQTYLVSDQEKYKAAHLMHDVRLDAHFDGTFFSYVATCTKSDRPFWDAIFAELRVQPSEIIFWDDDPKNISFAAELGVHARQYVNPAGLKRQLSNVGLH